jgi:general stress protein 26
MSRSDAVADAIRSSWFCTLATTSAANRPHAAGVLYAVVGRDLYVNTDRESRKARNVAENARVAVCIAVEGQPGGPPNTISLQGRAELLANDDPDIVRLVADGSLAAVTSHGELDRPGTCFVKITPGSRVAYYGVGVSEEQLAADPLSAFGSVDF